MYPTKNRTLDLDIRSRVNNAIHLLNEGHPNEARQAALDVLFNGTDVLVETKDLDVLNAIESLLTSLGDTASAEQVVARRADIVESPTICSMTQFNDDFSTVDQLHVRNAAATVVSGQFLLAGKNVYMHGSEHSPNAEKMFTALRKFRSAHDRPLENETRVAFNMGHISPNMWHFSINSLSRLAYLNKEQLLSYDIFTGFGKMRDHHRELIVSMGVPAERLVEFDVDETVHFDNVTQYPCGTYAYYRDASETGRAYQWDPQIIQNIRARILDHVGIKKKKPNKPVFIWRSPEGKRELLNQEEIVEHLGYTVLNPVTLSLAEQAEIMSEASIVIGSFGAGLRMMMFAPTAIPVIELKPMGLTSSCYELIAAALGQRFSSLSGETVGLDPQSDSWKDREEADYRVSLEDIDDAIRSASG